MHVILCSAHVSVIFLGVDRSQSMTVSAGVPDGSITAVVVVASVSDSFTTSETRLLSSSNNSVGAHGL